MLPYSPPEAAVRAEEKIMELKHSGFGIASFVISIISGVSLFVVFGIAGMAEVSTPGGLDENSEQAVMLGIAMMFFFVISLVAFGLGIGGLFQKERKKVFAILGVVFSAITALCTVALIAFGLTAG
jgi:hypothetical protein